MKKRIVLIASCLAVSSILAASVAVLTSSPKFNDVAFADKNNYTLTIDMASQLTRHNAQKYVITSSGNQFNYHFANCAYDDEEITAHNAICMLRSNGSGLYLDSPIQTIKSFSITFDSAETLHVYFDKTPSSFSSESENVYLHSGDVFEPTDGEDIYVDIWSNITTYVTSITITYACA